MNVLVGDVVDGRLGSLSLPVAGSGPMHVIVRSYDLKFWRADDGGVAVVHRVTPLGDRVRVEAVLDDGPAIFAQFPRRSSLLVGIETGVRIAIEVTHARGWPAHEPAGEHK